MLIHYRADGSRVDDTGESKEELDRLELIAQAWRISDQTGDKSLLIELGILPLVGL